MRLFRHSRGWLAAWLVLAASALVRADTPRDPLRLIPEQADFLVKVEQPRQLVEAITHLDLFKQVQSLEAVRELYDSTNVRRLLQLVAYFEKELGVGRLELLDRLAGHGAVLAVRFHPKPTPILFVVQGKDEALLRQFFKLALEVVEQELARQEAKDQPVKGRYRDLDTIRIGEKFHAAVAGSALLISNLEKGLHSGIDRHLANDQKSLADSSSVAEARKLVPAEALAWTWLNLETVRKAPAAKDVFTLPRNDPQLTVLFGGWLDVAGRSPFLCAALTPERPGFRLSVRMPRGREGMSEALAAHVPPADQPGALPLLEPKGVLYSSSFFLNVSQFWEQRAKLFNDKQLKGLEEFNKNSGVFLAGTQFSKLLTQAGAQHRLVVANSAKSSYKTVPAQRIPAFAAVIDMREPDAFARSMEAILRAAALLGTTQVKLKLVEEKHGARTLVGYRFAEDVPSKGDVNQIRFNFSPCFVRVHKYFLVSSTLELGHELIDLLEQEAKEPPAKASAASERSRLYASGGAELLRDNEDVIIAQTILGQALAPPAAKEQVRTLIDLVRRLGVVQLEERYGAQDFRYDIRWLPSR